MARINGNNGRNVLFGTRFDDRIDGRGGSDLIEGNAGFDFIDAGRGDDVVNGGENPDFIRGGLGNDILAGGSGSDLIFGDDTGAGGGSSADVTTSNTTTIPSTQQDFSVSLTAPDASNATSYKISGLVSADAVTSSNINVAVPFDISGSTGGTFSGTSVGDLNGNGSADEIIDGEIAGALALIDSVRTGGFPNATFAIIPFDGSARTPFIRRANEDRDNNGVSDLEEFLRSQTATGLTNFEEPLQESIGFFNSRTGGQNFVFFLSDGFGSGAFSDEVATLLDPNGIDATIRSFPIGTGASVTQLDEIDDGVVNGSVSTIADPGALSAAITGGGINPADVQELRVFVNGTLTQTLPAASLTPTALGLRYEVTLTGLDPNAAETVRVVAVASDGQRSTVATQQVVENLVSGGDDVIYGGIGSDTIVGQAGNDRIFGGDANDTLNGNDGFDTIFGGEGDDLLRGGTLADQLYGAVGNDRLFGNLGNDRIFGGIGNDRVVGQAGNDRVFGGDGADRLFGGNGNDRLFGGNGNDRLFGGNGSDLLVGAAGADRLAGGGGADTFVFANGFGRDRIVDFTDDVDTIRINDNLFTGTQTAQQIVNNFGAISGGNAVFDFGGGNVLTVENVTNLNVLVDDIAVI